METYGVDGITIGTVTARNVGGSGLLLDQTINATVGTVDAENAGAGTDRVDIANTGNNAILIENCPNVSIATNGGTISGGEVRLAERTATRRPQFSGRHARFRRSGGVAAPTSGRTILRT